MSQQTNLLSPVSETLEQLFPELLFPSQQKVWHDEDVEGRSAVEALLQSEDGICSLSIPSTASSSDPLPPPARRGKSISAMKAMLPLRKKRSYKRRAASATVLTPLKKTAALEAAGTRERPFQPSSCRASSSETPLSAQPAPPLPPRTKEDSASRPPSSPTSTRMKSMISSVTVTHSGFISPIVKTRTPLGYIMDLFDSCISPNLKSPNSSSTSSSQILYRQMYRRLVSDLAQIHLTSYSPNIKPDDLFCVAIDVFQGLGLVPPF